MLISEKEPDTLIVAGSILWAIPGKVKFDVQNGLSENVALVYNTVPSPSCVATRLSIVITSNMKVWMLAQRMGRCLPSALKAR
jgi:hypothetical protein